MTGLRLCTPTPTYVMPDRSAPTVPVAASPGFFSRLCGCGIKPVYVLPSASPPTAITQTPPQAPSEPAAGSGAAGGSSRASGSKHSGAVTSRKTLIAFPVEAFELLRSEAVHVEVTRHAD